MSDPAATQASIPIEDANAAGPIHSHVTCGIWTGVNAATPARPYLSCLHLSAMTRGGAIANRRSAAPPAGKAVRDAHTTDHPRTGGQKASLSLCASAGPQEGGRQAALGVAPPVQPQLFAAGLLSSGRRV